MPTVGQHNDKLKDLEFFESTHSYFYKGSQVISVTQALEAVGISDFTNVPTEDLERARIIGDLVHEMARLYGLGILDESTVDPQLNGYLNAIKKFYAERVKEIIDIEAKIFNKTFMYAGTLDLVYRSHDDRVYLEDFKTAKIAMPAAELQTSAYKYSYEKLYGIKIHHRAGVHLDNFGEYHRYPYNNKQDFHTFVQAIGVANFKQLREIKT